MEMSEKELEMVIDSLRIGMGLEYATTDIGYIGVCSVLRDVLASSSYTEEVKEALLLDIMKTYTERLTNKNKLKDFDFNVTMYYGDSAYISKMVDNIRSTNNIKELINYFKGMNGMSSPRYINTEYRYRLGDEDIMLAYDIVDGAVRCLNSKLYSNIETHVNVLDIYNPKGSCEVDIYDIDDTTHVAVSMYLSKDVRFGIYDLIHGICKSVAYFMLSFELESAFNQEMEKEFKGYIRGNTEFKAKCIADVLKSVVIVQSDNEFAKKLIKKKDIKIKGTQLETLLINMCYNM